MRGTVEEIRSHRNPWHFLFLNFVHGCKRNVILMICWSVSGTPNCDGLIARWYRAKNRPRVNCSDRDSSASAS